jgi:hypothetical protein
VAAIMSQLIARGEINASEEQVSDASVCRLKLSARLSGVWWGLLVSGNMGI